MSITAEPTVITSANPTPTLTRWRLHVMRGGYLFMALGLAIVKWPLLPDVATMPLYEGVTLCLLTAMSLLAILGLRYPVKLLPVLLFETMWKVLWLGLVAAPNAASGSLDAAMAEIAVNCSFVAVIAAVIPWRYVWAQFLRAPAERAPGARPLA